MFVPHYSDLIKFSQTSDEQNQSKAIELSFHHHKGIELNGEIPRFSGKIVLKLTFTLRSMNLARTRRSDKAAGGAPEH
jgi:hypothetical protein